MAHIIITIVIIESSIIEPYGGRVLVQAPVTDILGDDRGKAIDECVGGQRLSVESCVCALFARFLCGLVDSVSLLEICGMCN